MYSINQDHQLFECVTQMADSAAVEGRLGLSTYTGKIGSRMFSWYAPPKIGRKFELNSVKTFFVLH